MRERQERKTIDGREVLFREPTFTEVVQLPKVVETVDTWDTSEKRDILLGMHTDMLGAFSHAISSFRENTQKELYIQGRVLTRDQFWKLRGSPAWSFFWEGRAYRSRSWNQKEVASYILPKNAKLTKEDVQMYSKMNFNPETTKKKLRHKVGWFNAHSMVNNPMYDSYGQNSLMGVLGACNQFKVGSDTLSPRILQLVRGRFIEYFRNEHIIVKLDKRWLEETLLEVTSRIFRV